MRLIYMPSNTLHMIGGGDFSLSAVPRLNLRGGQRRRLRRLLHRGGGGGVCHQVRGENINNDYSNNNDEHTVLCPNSGHDFILTLTYSTTLNNLLTHMNQWPRLHPGAVRSGGRRGDEDDDDDGEEGVEGDDEDEEGDGDDDV